MPSRHTLHSSVLKRRDDGDVYIRIQPADVFCPLIDEAFPSLGHRGWHDAESSAGYTYVSGMSDAKFSELSAFLKLFETGIVLTPSKHISPYFASEVDHCLALDWTFPLRNCETRTPIYQLVYDAKYNPKSSRRDKRIAAIAHAHGVPARNLVHPMESMHYLDSVFSARRILWKSGSD